MNNYKALKSAGKTSVAKAKVIKAVRKEDDLPVAIKLMSQSQFK